MLDEALLAAAGAENVRLGARCVGDSLGCLLRDGFVRGMPQCPQIAQRDRLSAFVPPTL